MAIIMDRGSVALWTLRRYYPSWPLVTSLAVFWMMSAVLLTSSILRNGGHVVYAQDDPYIHMAVAKNFSSAGIFGVTRYGFTASSSSPLWTLLLSLLFKACGPREIHPPLPQPDLRLPPHRLCLLLFARCRPSPLRPFSPPPFHHFCPASARPDLHGPGAHGAHFDLPAACL